MAEKKRQLAWAEATPEGEVVVHQGQPVAHKDGTVSVKATHDFVLDGDAAVDFFVSFKDAVEEARTNLATHRHRVAEVGA